MNSKVAQQILERVERILTDASVRNPKTRLNKVHHVLAEQRCNCGRGWLRGGERQGAMLCERCYSEETI